MNNRVGDSRKREAKQRRRIHFVYRVYDEHDYLLYIGLSNNPKRRWYAHRRAGAAWVPFAHHWRLTGPLDYQAGRELEGREIYKHQPPYNKRGLLGGVDLDPTRYHSEVAA